MKKKFFLCCILWLFQTSFILAIVEEGKVESFKPDERIEKPKTEKEAQKLEERYKETERKYGSPKEFENKISLKEKQVKFETGEKQEELNKTIQEEKEILKRYEGAKTVIEEFKKELVEAYEPAVPVKPAKPEEPILPELTEEEKVEKLSFGKRIIEAVKSWVQSARNKIAGWFSNKEKAQGTVDTLRSISDDFKADGPLAPERLPKDHREEAAILNERIINKDIPAIEEILQKEIRVPQKTIEEAATAAISDVIQISKAAEAIPEPSRSRVNKKISKVEADFGITSEDRSVIEKQATQERKKDIQKGEAEIREQLSEVSAMTAEQRDAYVKKVLTIAEANLAVLPPEEKAIVHVTTRDALAGATDAALKEAIDTNKSVEDRVKAVEQTLDYVPELGKTENQLHESFKDVVQKEGQEPEKKLDVLTEAQVEQMKKQLNQALEEMLKKINAPDQAYTILKKRIDAMEKVIDPKDISIEKLEAQVNMMNAKLEVLKKFKGEGKAAKEIIDSLFRTIETTQKMEINRSAMIKSDKQGNPIVVKEVPAAPPLPAKEFIAQKQKESVEYQQKLKKEGKPPDSHDKLLESIRSGATLRKVTISEEPKARNEELNVFSHALDTMLKKGVIKKAPPPG